jgi:formate hydrogenlyase subunit 3/multisubunit Na+/H+ antiporter MnhD subunit
MSGVMIKTGIYGLVRFLCFLGTPPSWWGWLLIVLGIVSGVFGVLFALAQHDLKRLLAYHSVENIGIIVLGLGMGVLGNSLDLPWLAALGFAGCLLHVVNHALFKGLLFLGAGSVLKAARSGEIDHLGGLLKRMPWTGATFVVGAAAISGLPPLNGFISEMLLFAGGLAGIARGGTSAALAGLSVVAALALISGLAVACFTKAFGIVFLGEPRSEEAREARECTYAMRAAMIFLALGCLIVGLGAAWIPAWLQSTVAVAGRMPAQLAADAMTDAAGFLTIAVLGFSALIGLCLLLALLRARLLAHRTVETAVTWDCGYARPTNRMQYTASSFAQPITELFKGVLGTHAGFSMAAHLFPRSAVFSSETPDPCLEPVFGRLFRSFAMAAAKMRWLQHGNIHLYVLYIGLTLLGMLFWIMD